jgi:hypothetical protein
MNRVMVRYQIHPDRVVVTTLIEIGAYDGGGS